MRLHLLAYLPSARRIGSGAAAAVLVAVAITLMMSQSFAADGESTTYDVGPIVVALLTVLGPSIASALCVIGMWVLFKLAAFIGLKIDDRRRAAIEQGLDRSIGLAVSRFENKALGGIPIQMKNGAIVVAAEYARRAIPGALKHFGKTPEDLAEMIESRLEGVLIDPAVEVCDPSARRLRSATASAAS